MPQRSYTWLLPTFGGAFLFFGGLLFNPGISVFGTSVDLLAILVGPVVFLVGVAWALVLAVHNLRGPGSLSQRLGWSAPAGYAVNPAYGDDDDGHRRRRGSDDRRGPAVNVDGTPMASAHVDINGNAYGATEHRYDAGGFSSGGSFGGGFSNSRW
ncbi:hypothetical protein AA671_08610 [Delftia tsuruhatensis]|uniref:hypothetical protein n=1 Tax=Delftia tsuruhatensis TaxID=180282 RepID=UPI00064222CD|nr:hypothetical protein [Delftia tsuruhatensis]KLO59607.1 hypothetical protein AA671_08610 [Delftia tsuruhatensis]